MGAWEDGFAAGMLAGMKASSDFDSRVAPRIKSLSSTPKKRKARGLTSYNRFMKKEMRSLRRKHPRMKQPQIMKKAAKAWRRKRRG